MAIQTTSTQKTAEEILALLKDQQLPALWNYQNPALLNDSIASFHYFTPLEATFTAEGETLLARQVWRAYIHPACGI